MSHIEEMNRRALLKKVAIMTGGVLSASVVSGFMSGAFAQGAPEIDNPVFSNAELNLVAEIADMIIPDTDTPGASKAGVHHYIHAMVGDWYNAGERENFMKGLVAIDGGFMTGSSGERTKIITNMDLEENSGDVKTFFEEFKELTLIGYFTSQIGAEEELRYEQYPGPYQGCVPFEQVGRTWAT